MGIVSDAFDLSGKVAIVTGGARGIGKAAAQAMGDVGAHVVLADLLDDAMTETASELKSNGMSVETARLDVSDSKAVDALVNATVAKHGRLDVMVNNAAIITESTPLNVTEEELDKVHRVNFKGVVFGSQAAARVMIPQGAGSIINIASGAIDGPTPMMIAYATAKAAASHFSRSLALEIGKHGVRVNVVAPGWTDTPMNERHVLRPDGSIDEEKKAAYVAMRAASAALGKPGEAMDQAMAILYLASNAAKFVTGQVIRPNGGTSMLW
ncbi:MAG: SDR family NAD(P)-dependent oxidoreductase [Acidimicrobiia bacterium]